MASLDTHRPEPQHPGPHPQEGCPIHGNKCPTCHLKAFQKIAGKWQGTVTQYSLDGQVLGSVKIDAENRLDCDSLYTLLVFTDPQGNQQRVEFTSAYSRKIDGFVVDNQAIKGTALEVGDSVVYMYENKGPTPSNTFESVVVEGNTRLHSLLNSSGGAFTGYAIVRETRVSNP
ncbi:MAG: hypothetical protein ACXU86_01425 [Archangium sp.]